MKKVILYIIIMIGTLLLPNPKEDVGNLEPIQAVWLQKDELGVVLQTDTDDIGYGVDVYQALADMKLHSAGVIYLDTAEFVLAEEDAQAYIGELKGMLDGSVRICLWDGEGELVDAARYMQSHKTGMKLEDWQVGKALVKITEIS